MGIDGSSCCGDGVVGVVGVAVLVVGCSDVVWFWDCFVGVLRCMNRIPIVAPVSFFGFGFVVGVLVIWLAGAEISIFMVRYGGVVYGR